MLAHIKIFLTFNCFQKAYMADFWAIMNTKS